MGMRVELKAGSLSKAPAKNSKYLRRGANLPPYGRGRATNPGAPACRITRPAGRAHIGPPAVHPGQSSYDCALGG